MKLIIFRLLKAASTHLENSSLSFEEKPISIPNHALCQITIFKFSLEDKVSESELIFGGKKEILLCKINEHFSPNSSKPLKIFTIELIFVSIFVRSTKFLRKGWASYSSKIGKWFSGGIPKMSWVNPFEGKEGLNGKGQRNNQSYLCLSHIKAQNLESMQCVLFLKSRVLCGCQQ